MQADAWPSFLPWIISGHFSKPFQVHNVASKCHYWTEPYHPIHIEQHVSHPLVIFAGCHKFEHKHILMMMLNFMQLFGESGYETLT